MAGLNACIAQIQANMDVRLPGLSYLTGAKNLGRQGSGNQVTFVPSVDTFDAGKQMRPGAFTIPGVSGSPTPTFVAQRVTFVKRAGLKVYLWGVPTKADNTRAPQVYAINRGAGDRDSIDQTELMVDALLSACVDAASLPNVQVNSGQWSDQEGEALTQYGLEYVLDLTLCIPIVQFESRDVPVTAVQPTAVFVHP